MNRGEGFGGGVRPLAADAAGGTGAADTPGVAAPGSVPPSPPAVAPVEPTARGPAEPGDPGPIPPQEPPMTLEPAEPQHVSLTGARAALLFTPPVDGTEGWLGPAYAFTTGDGEGDGPVVMAVEGEFLE